MRLHFRRIALFAQLALAPVAGAEACSAFEHDTPHSLIDRADGIYRVRATRFSSAIRRGKKDEWSPLPASTIQFDVLEVLKGTGVRTLTAPARVDGHDDFNDRPVPYEFVRPGGRHGNCFATSYQVGREYLLIVKGGTPYWSALGPTNEQVRGADDPWVRWVRTAFVEVAAHPGKYPPIRSSMAPDSPPRKPEPPTPKASLVDDAELGYLLVHMEVLAESPPSRLSDSKRRYRILGYTKQGSCAPNCPPTTLYVATWDYLEHRDGDIRACRIDGLHFVDKVSVGSYESSKDSFLTFAAVSRFDLHAPRRYEISVGTSGCSIRDAGPVDRTQ